jgi:hypothetical protein
VSSLALNNGLGQGVEYIHGSMKAVEDGHILVSRQGSPLGTVSSLESAEEKVTYDYLLLACGRFAVILGCCPNCMHANSAVQQDEISCLGAVV